MELLWRRGLGRLVDELLVMALQLVSLVTWAFIYVVFGWNHPAPTGAVILAWTVVVSGLLFGLGYEAVGTWAGASFGKLICGTRIADAATGGRLPLGRSVGRALLVSGPQPLVWLAFTIGEGIKTRDAIVLSSLVAAGLAWRLALLISVVGSSGHDSIHDHMVRSVVVRPWPSR